jgi:hypothetical protein
LISRSSWGIIITMKDALVNSPSGDASRRK